MDKIKKRAENIRIFCVLTNPLYYIILAVLMLTYLTGRLILFLAKKAGIW